MFPYLDRSIRGRMEKVVSDYKFIFESQWNENRDREEVKFDVCGETSTVFCRFNRI